MDGRKPSAIGTRGEVKAKSSYSLHLLDVMAIFTTLLREIEMEQIGDDFRGRIYVKTRRGEPDTSESIRR